MDSFFNRELEGLFVHWPDRTFGQIAFTIENFNRFPCPNSTNPYQVVNFFPFQFRQELASIPIAAKCPQHAFVSWEIGTIGNTGQK